MRYILILLLLSSPVSAEVYKTINPDGSVSYSDVQTKDSKSITPPGLTPTPAVKLAKKPQQKAQESKTPKRYTVFEITSPKNNQTIKNNNGQIPVTLKITPKLQDNFKHTISLVLDGSVVASKLTSANHTLKDVFRGRHSLSARLIDKNGTVLKSSNLVFVNVRRFSQLNKQLIQNREAPPPTDSDSDSDQTQTPWPTPADPDKPQNPWPTLPDYSNPKNVWPTPPGTTTPPASP